MLSTNRTFRSPQRMYVRRLRMRISPNGGRPTSGRRSLSSCPADGRSRLSGRVTFNVQVLRGAQHGALQIGEQAVLGWEGDRVAYELFDAFGVPRRQPANQVSPVRRGSRRRFGEQPAKVRGVSYTLAHVV